MTDGQKCISPNDLDLERPAQRPGQPRGRAVNFVAVEAGSGAEVDGGRDDLEVAVGVLPVDLVVEVGQEGALEVDLDDSQVGVSEHDLAATGIGAEAGRWVGGRRVGPGDTTIGRHVDTRGRRRLAAPGQMFRNMARQVACLSYQDRTYDRDWTLRG